MARLCQQSQHRLVGTEKVNIKGRSTCNNANGQPKYKYSALRDLISGSASESRLYRASAGVQAA